MPAIQARVLEILVIAVLLFGVPILVVMILAGAAAYVREGAERELEAMAEKEGIDLDDPDSFVDPDEMPRDKMPQEERSGIDAVERDERWEKSPAESTPAESTPAESNDEH